jgi:predicted O-linked N-acetylglucosamine transferase (SPINDLY family)
MSARRSFDRALELQARGKIDEAIALVRLALRKDNDPNLLAVMGALLIAKKQFPQAEHFLRGAAAGLPGQAEPLSNLGAVLVAQGKHADAAAALEQAVAANPLSEDARLMLVASLEAAGRLAGAVGVASEGVSLLPESARLLGKLGDVLHATGRVEEALEVLGRAARLEPFDVSLADQICAAMTYTPDAAPEERLGAFKRFGWLSEREAGKPFAWDRAKLAARTAGRPLRVGLISPDLRRHAVATFIEPFLEHADGSRVEVTCYNAAAKEDEVSAHLRSLADRWRHIKDLGNREAASLIRDDQIDVLIDLAGHTWANRLGVLALRPAPVQMTYMGFPSTTGLSTIDFRVVDSLTDPAGFEAQGTESLVRMDPCFMTYKPASPLPAVGALPMASSGAATFASYSSLLKLNKRLIGVWAKVLAAVPGSRLILKHVGLRDPEVRADVASRLETAGAPRGSIVCEGPEPSIREVLPLYGRVDIALDTFPFNGATTVCDAMVMGVPVVGLRGTTSAGRVGLSLLTAVGLGDLCAEDEDGYVRTAVELAGDVERLRSIRAGLRERFLTSEVVNSRGGAARLTDAVCRAWQEFLAGGDSGSVQ